MIIEQDNLCYCILTLQCVKRHYVAGYLLSNGAGTDTDGTTFTSASYSNGFTVTLRIRATTGTYYSVPAVSETFTVRGEDLQVQY